LESQGTMEPEPPKQSKIRNPILALAIFISLFALAVMIGAPSLCSGNRPPMGLEDFKGLLLLFAVGVGACLIWLAVVLVRSYFEE